MKICYFGNFNPAYSRNRVIIKGLEHHGARIVHELRKPHDLVIVGYSDSRWTVLIAWVWCLLSGKALVWDAFYSRYDSWVFDRKLASPRSIKGWYYWLLDWLCCRLADRVLLDTYTHIEYFVKTFHITRSKFIRVLVGTDETIFHPFLG
ncbi:MAG: hypothetical protein AAB483_01435 [Patescibacteria group bacterium]